MDRCFLVNRSAEGDDDSGGRMMVNSVSRSSMGDLLRRLTRRKHLDTTSTAGSSLARCLTTWDLTLLGVGSTLGVGVYVLAGGVARDTAGPSVVLSFLIAGLASALSGLCYAEFGSRVPRAGSAYVYSYVTVGELAAFVIGWNLVLEYVIGTASVARGYSGYLDSLMNNTMQNAYKSFMPISQPFLADYPDFTAFAITMILAVLLSIGVKESSRFNNIFTILNLGVVLFVTVVGMTQADPSNWSLELSNTTKSEFHSDGGFFPYGLSGTLSGAATCFYGFVGFDAIATTGEETQNPQKSIPVAIIISLSLVALAYTGISSTLTLMVPYYLQDSNAPLPSAFNHLGLRWAGWVVGVGALFGLSTSLLGAMFPLPRVVYAMASDGMVPRRLARVHSSTKTPLTATLLSGSLAALMALLFDLSQLVDMMSIGTLLAYTMVGVCVLVLRYRDSSMQSGQYKPLATQDLDDSEEELFPFNTNTNFTFSWGQYLRQCLNLDQVVAPTPLTSSIANHSIIAFTILCLLLSVMSASPSSSLHNLAMVIIVVKMFLCVLVLHKQPQDPSSLSFSVPLVPWLPTTSILTNIFLTCKLSWQTWIRFSVWMTFGFLIYGCYGWRNSSEEYRMNGLKPPEENEDNIDDLKLSKIDRKQNSKFLDDFE